jgi:transcriptional regulator with XRE-family HTH domain
MMVEPQSRATEVFGRNLRRWRTKRGLSQEDLSALAEIHATNIGKLERGERNPSLTTVIRLASALEVKPAVLIEDITGDDIPPTSHQRTLKDWLREQKSARG